MSEKIEYRKVTYLQLQIELHKHWASTDKRKTHIDLAQEIKVGSVTTIQNAFWTKGGKQKASDQVLTAVMKAVGFLGKIEWIDGKRYYYISEN